MKNVSTIGKERAVENNKSQMVSSWCWVQKMEEFRSSLKEWWLSCALFVGGYKFHN